MLSADSRDFKFTLSRFSLVLGYGAHEPISRRICIAGCDELLGDTEAAPGATMRYISRQVLGATERLPCSPIDASSARVFAAYLFTYPSILIMNISLNSFVESSIA